MNLVVKISTQVCFLFTRLLVLKQADCSSALEVILSLRCREERQQLRVRFGCLRFHVGDSCRELEDAGLCGENVHANRILSAELQQCLIGNSRDVF